MAMSSEQMRQEIDRLQHLEATLELTEARKRVRALGGDPDQGHEEQESSVGQAKRRKARSAHDTEGPRGRVRGRPPRQ